MTTDELALCWVPIPLRWRHVQPGDVITGHNGGLFTVARCTPSQGQVAIQAVQANDPINTYADPDETVHVLVPLPERDALTTARDELAARVIERRTT